MYEEIMRKELEESSAIAPREVTLRLSGADCRRLAETAGMAGMSVGELLEAFVGDLVDGAHSHGSDERMYARMWFDRCGFAYIADHTFLRYLLKYDSVDDFLGHYDILKECQEDLLAEEPVNSPEDNREEIEYQRSWLQEVYDGYERDVWLDSNVLCETKAESFDEGLARVLQWRDETDKLLRPAREARQAAAQPEPEYAPELD